MNVFYLGKQKNYHQTQIFSHKIANRYLNNNIQSSYQIYS